MKKTNFLLILIFLLGLFFRFWQITRIPPGLTPDEAAQGYTAWSILKTGKDEWGEKLPFNPRSFGDFKPPLQTYLMIPSVALFGLNEFGVRFPNAFLSSLAILTVFLLVKELFASRLIAVFSAFLIAFSPWHLPLSRGGFEANLTVFFISLAGYLFLKNDSKSRALSALIFGLNMFSYHSAKLATPLVIVFLIWFKKEIKNLKPFFFIYTVLFLIAFSSFFKGGQTRGLDIAVFQPTDRWQSVKDERWFGVSQGLPDLAVRVFHNKVSYSFSRFVKNYLGYLSPEFLFSEGPAEGTYGLIPGRGVLWWWELPLLLIGFYYLIKKPKREVLLISALILIALIPGAMTKGERMANRAAGAIPWIQIFSAWVLGELSLKIARLKNREVKIGFNLVFGLVFIFFFSFFLEDYFLQSLKKISRPMLYGRCQALREVDLEEAEKVIVSRKLSEPQAYVMFCFQYPPELAQKQVPEWLEYQEKGLGFVDQLGEYQLGKFVFKEIHWLTDSELKNTALVGLPEEFPPGFDQGKIISYPDGQAAIIVYQTKTPEVYAVQR